MVFNKKDLMGGKAFSPSRTVKTGIRRRLPAGGGSAKPGTSSGSTMKTEDTSEISIKVIVRVRPHNERELQDNSRKIIEVVDDRMLIFDPKEDATPFFFHNVAQKGRDMLKKQNKQLQFIFDQVFDSISTNIDVFEGSTKSLINSLLDGYNCSVFAYGATGAGKTHTMLGNRDDPGITYRTVAQLFSEIEKQSKHREFNLGVSYLEIYNENVQDLLHKSGQLHLREDGRCGVVVAGLEPTAIQNAEELLSLLAEGNKNRTQHPTDANKESSRSHAVFQVYIKIINKLDSQVQRVKLSMIDLAGSERASATGCKGVRFKEGANINKSLLALGNCINNLADGIKYIPYRDSKLTRLLKDSLGGNCHTVMIANIAPCNVTYEDTYNTLRYANRAKKIKSYAKKNVSCEMHVAGYIKIVEEQKKEIDVLKAKLAAFENGTVQPVVENKPSAVMLDTYNKLVKLHERKKSLMEKMLALESSYKILACRILYKKDADERLHNLTTAGDALSLEEQNASGKSRINKSLHYFQRQRESFKAQMQATWQELCSVETEIQEMKTKSLDENLQNKLSLEIFKIEKCWITSMQQHMKKLSSLLQCERQSINTITKSMSNTLQNYYNMVKGYGTMTDKMQLEFKELIKLLEGIRNIKWSDSDEISKVDDFNMFTCLSTVGMDPLNNEIPVTPEMDDKEHDVCNMNVNSTFSTENNIDSNISNLNDEGNSHENGKFILKDESVQETLREKIVANSIIRKRVLNDKNSENSNTPSKQTKKLTTNNKVQSTGRVDKENKQRPVQMSAKSISILNKLKSDATNISSLSRHNNSEEKTDMAFKAVRNKERRGLMTTHPYQKPTIGKKPGPALPSTRVPW